MAEQDSLRVYLDNGQIRIFKDPYHGGFIEEYVYYRFDDIQNGLYADIGGYYINKRGVKAPGTNLDLCDANHYARIPLVSPEDLKQVHHIEYKDKRVAMRLCGELVCIVPLLLIGENYLHRSVIAEESIEDYLRAVYSKFAVSAGNSLTGEEKLDVFARQTHISVRIIKEVLTRTEPTGKEPIAKFDQIEEKGVLAV